MKCQKCNEEMEEGMLSEPGEINVDFYFKNRKALGIFNKSVKLKAWRCSKCGKIELLTDPAAKEEL